MTPEQIAKFPEYVERWLNIGLSTEPVDFENAKKAICLAYKLANLKEPTQFFVADSPVSAIKLIQEMDSSLQAEEIFSKMIYGNHDASWLSIYQYFRDEVGIEACHKLDGLIELSKYAGWTSVYEDVVVFQHRPEMIKFDNEKRLHNESGPAVRYRDGFSVYAWHGLRIPSEWIDHKDQLTAKTALTWKNIEQRRAACEILGWNNILRELNATTIDKDNDPEIGELVEVTIPDIGKERFLRVLCGTKREFALPVPPDTKTTLDAQAWTYGLSKKDFEIPEVRT